ncbi:MAG: RagB/SusD family nutrient uptake outer membrane protein [Dysgonomonas sp.]
MKTKQYICLLISSVLLSTTSCSDWLDQEPLSNVTTSVYFTKASEFESAANYLYSQVQGYNSESSYELFDYGTDLSFLYDSELSGNDGASSSDKAYEKPYTNLRHVNNLLFQAENYKGTENIDVSVGIAYFFRAWWHFNLLQRFGGITLALEVPSTTSDIVWGPRNSRYEVIGSILSDLELAQKLLSNTTKTSTQNDGSVTIEAVCAFKARVCLFEGTWEKYNGRGESDVTNGNGNSTGGGIAMPQNYPSIEDLLKIAKTESAKFVQGGVYSDMYSIWMECENHPIDVYNKMSYYYLFALEEADSNPYGVTKASNNESVFRKCYDYSLQAYGGQNITHNEPCGASRKLIDMYLCTDGLPVHISPLFQGYNSFEDEFKNRDARMVSIFKQIGNSYWSASNEYGNVADYSKAPYEDETNKGGIYSPNLTSYSAGTFNGHFGYAGRKFCQERKRSTNQESADLMLIRLPEMLVTYAEATIELDGKIEDTELKNTINIIRQRAHIADLTNQLVSTYNLDMKEEIRRERTLELWGEGFRRTDLCRWGIAEEELSRPICTYYASYNGVPTKIATEDKPGYPGNKIYDPSVWEKRIMETEEIQSTYTAGVPTVKAGCLITEAVNNRNFTKKNYLQPIPTDQITLNNALKQNPQW